MEMGKRSKVEKEVQMLMCRYNKNTNNDLKCNLKYRRDRNIFIYKTYIFSVKLKYSAAHSPLWQQRTP
jgi:hypothetical protein